MNTGAYCETKRGKRDEFSDSEEEKPVLNPRGESDLIAKSRRDCVSLAKVRFFVRAGSFLRTSTRVSCTRYGSHCCRTIGPSLENAFQERRPSPAGVITAPSCAEPARGIGAYSADLRLVRRLDNCGRSAYGTCGADVMVERLREGESLLKNAPAVGTSGISH